MARRLPPLNALRAFEASARLGSFVAAAAELRVSAAAVSQQVRRLEEYLDTPLFLAPGARPHAHRPGPRLSTGAVGGLRPAGRIHDARARQARRRRADAHHACRLRQWLAAAAPASLSRARAARRRGAAHLAAGHGFPPRRHRSRHPLRARAGARVARRTAVPRGVVPGREPATLRRRPHARYVGGAGRVSAAARHRRRSRATLAGMARLVRTRRTIHCRGGPRAAVQRFHRAHRCGGGRPRHRHRARAARRPAAGAWPAGARHAGNVDGTVELFPHGAGGALPPAHRAHLRGLGASKRHAAPPLFDATATTATPGGANTSCRDARATADPARPRFPGRAIRRRRAWRGPCGKPPAAEA